jgi:hypothetical protein
MTIELNQINDHQFELCSENASLFVPRGALAGLQGCIR